MTTVPNSNRLDVFVRGQGPDFSLWHTFRTGDVLGVWERNAGAPPVSGGMTSRPAALYQSSTVGGDRWNVVALAGDNALYYTYYSAAAGWKTPWLKLPNGVLTTGAALTLNTNNRIDVWAVGQGPTKRVWHTWIYADQNPPVLSGSWEDSAGAPNTAPGALGVRGAPAAFSRATGEVDLVVQSADDNGLWHRNYNGSSWSSWTRLGSFWDVVTVEPALNSVYPGWLDVWARGSNGKLYHTAFSGRQPPSSLQWDANASAPPGGLASGFSVAATSPQSAIVDVFGVSTDGPLWTRRYYEAPPTAEVNAEFRIASPAGATDGFVPIKYPADPAAPPAPDMGSFFENTSVAIPPGGVAPAGGCPATTRLFVAVGQYGGWGSAALLRTDRIGVANRTRDVTNLLYRAANPTWGGMNNPYAFGTDNITTRAMGGELVHVRLGFNDSNPNGKNGNAFVWRSRDCGATWTGFHVADQGLDRHDVYADPWSSMVYMTASKNVSPNVSFMRMNLAAADPRFSSISYTGSLTSEAPMMMTSTRSGRLFIAQCTASGPKLTYTPRGFMGMSSGSTVFRNVSVNNEPCTYYDRGGGFEGSLSVSRISSSVDYDIVRLTYPIIVNENAVRRQKVRVRIVSVSANGATAIVSDAPGQPIAASSPTGSVWQVTAVETDRIELPGDDATNTTLYYWQESTSSPPTGSTTSAWRANNQFGTAQVRGLLVHDADFNGTRFNLSNANLTPTPGGDYIEGSFFFDPVTPDWLNYLAIWTIDQYIAGAVVRTQRTF